MLENEDQVKWRIIGQSVQGATHVRNQLPNQDAIDWWPKSATKLPLILAISDGHGSAKSFRSEHGSRLAVEVAIKALQGFVNDPHETDKLSAVKDFAELPLLQKLVIEWRESVKNHLDSNPFTNTEWERLVIKYGTAGRQTVEDNNFLAYGATLLAVLVTDSFTLYLQLGDGDFLCVDSDGETSRPFCENEKQLGDDTDSLCTNNAWQYIKVKFVRHLEYPPSMILVSSDGYSKSFGSEEDFLKIGRDYLEMIRTEGLDHVQEKLASILEETSCAGSGDDITLGIIKMLDDKDVIDNIKIHTEKLRVLESEMKEKVGKDEIRDFNASHTKIREELQITLEKAVRAYAKAVQELQTCFENATKIQINTVEELQKRLANTSKEESQIWKNFREEQQNQIVGIKNTLLEWSVEQKKLIKQIAKLQGMLIVTICFIVISVTSNISLWFWTYKTQTIAAPSVSKTP